MIAGPTNVCVVGPFLAGASGFSFWVERMLLKLQAHSDPDRGGDYAWSIAGGTGAYAGLRGTGTGYSVPADYGINDLLFGAVH